MHIENRRVNNILSRLAGVPQNGALRIVFLIDQDSQHKLTRIGFTDTPSNGDTLLPFPIGSVSRFNSEGKWLLHRNKPKESRYIRTVWWQWKQWAGGGEVEEHEDFRDIFRNCYPRELISPPSIEISYLEIDEKSFIVSRVFHHNPEEHEIIRHTVNLFLELFGSCDLVQADLTKFAEPAIKRLGWRLLPPGEDPWPHVERYLNLLKKRSEATATVIADRQETIRAYLPNEIYMGEGGFSDYLAYVFSTKNLVILESIQKGNAIYVFGKNWQAFSQLTKAEILNNKYHLARIIHSQGWKRKLAELMSSANAA